VLAVAATGLNDEKAAFSNYGPTVAVGAPGVLILSTDNLGDYASFHGTSQAAAHVAGTAALIWTTEFGRSNQAVVDRLCSTANAVAGTGTLWNCGRIDAAAATAPSGGGSPLQPVLECVEDTGKTALSAHFGYQNDAKSSVTRPPGKDNAFSPPPVDRGQPSLYEPGRQLDVFTVRFDGQPLTWTLDGRTATAARDSTPCAPATAEATIANFAYLPDPLEVPVGGTIRWTNLDTVAHTVTAQDRAWTSANLTQGETYTRTFSTPGTFNYFCEPHPFMQATVNVR
jgi:plastocyanin